MNIATQDTINVTYRSIKGDTLVIQRGFKVIATHDLVQIRSTSADYPYVYITPFGDTVALEHNFRKFELPIQPQVKLNAFDTIKPCILPPVGDTRLSSEFTHFVQHSVSNSPNYNDISGSAVLSVMIFATAYSFARSIQYWGEMFSKIKLALKGDIGVNT